MTIKDLIHQNLDILLKKQSEKSEGLNMSQAIKIGAYVAAGVLRSRHKEEKKILPEEIDGVYNIIGNFFLTNFPSFKQTDFENLKKDSLELLQKPSFDKDLDEFVQSIIE